MAEITAQMVKELRTATSAGMMDCKSALAEADGDFEKAVEVLRKKGLKKVGKRADREVSEGIVYSYIHGNGRIGVMIELNSETDFVARNDDFTELAKVLAMHIAWAAPQFVAREEVPEELIAAEKEVLRGQLKPEQEKMADKIIEGKLEKWYSEICLLEQADAREPSAKRSMGDLVNEVSAKVGEKVLVRRFARFEVGA